MNNNAALDVNNDTVPEVNLTRNCGTIATPGRLWYFGTVSDYSRQATPRQSLVELVVLLGLG